MQDTPILVYLHLLFASFPHHASWQSSEFPTQKEAKKEAPTKWIAPVSIYNLHMYLGVFSQSGCDAFCLQHTKTALSIKSHNSSKTGALSLPAGKDTLFEQRAPFSFFLAMKTPGPHSISITVKAFLDLHHCHRLSFYHSHTEMLSVFKGRIHVTMASVLEVIGTGLQKSTERKQNLLVHIHPTSYVNMLFPFLSSEFYIMLPLGWVVNIHLKKELSATHMKTSPQPHKCFHNVCCTRTTRTWMLSLLSTEKRGKNQQPDVINRLDAKQFKLSFSIFIHINNFSHKK